MNTRMPSYWRDTNHIRETRDALMTEARTLHARVETERRSFTPEESLTHSELLDAIDRTTTAMLARENAALPLVVRDVDGAAHDIGAAFARGANVSHGKHIETRTLGRQIVSAPGFAAFRSAGAGTHVGFDLRLETRATSVTGSICGGVLTPPPPVIGSAAPPASLITLPRPSDLVPHRADGGTVCTFPEYGARTGSTAHVAPGGTKPDVGLTVIYKQAVFEKIAGIAVVNDEVLEDDPGAIAALDSELYIDLLNEIDKAILTETGAAGHFMGLIPGSTGPDTAATGLTPTGAILTAMGAIQAASGVLPDGLVMSFATAAAIATTLASTSGVYLGGEPSIGPLPPWAAGLRLALSPDVPNGTALIGSFSRGAGLVSKSAMRVERSSSGDLFASNQTMLRVEQRLALCIFRPLSFGTITALPGGS